MSAEQAAALVREFEKLIALELRHPAVAAPIAAGVDDHAAYLAMEYVVGDPLDVRMRDRGRMPVPETAAVLRAVASAVDAAADRGVHHGRLHPRDVIMSADGPRVTGFGIADALARVGVRTEMRRPYTAPEGPSDVYSLAAIGYEMISGNRMTPSGWDELSAEDGPALRAAFAAALSPDPAARPARALDFAQMLAEPEAREQAPRVAMQAPPAETDDIEPEFALDLPLASEAEQDPNLDAPFPPSWSAQPPRPFQMDVPASTEGTGKGKFLAAALVVILLMFGAGYFLSRPHRAPGPQAAPAKPAVSSTTVDVGRAAAPPRAVPPEPALPAPAPSRPASGASPPPAVPRTPTPKPATAPAASGRLLIRSTPAGASVEINGEARGKTPVTVRDLALGSYTIHVTQDGFAAADRRVRLTSAQPTASLEIPLTAIAAGPGSLSIESRPSGARVFVNNRLIGSTPLVMPGLPAGPATVRIEMDGYRTWATTVQVAAGEQMRVTASLEH